MVSDYLNYDPSSEIHGICLILPSNCNSLSSEILSELQETCSLFPPKMKENIVVIITFENDATDYTYNILKDLGFLASGRFFVNLTTLFSNSKIMLERKKWENTVQSLKLFLEYVARLSPKTMEKCLPKISDKPPIPTGNLQRPRPASCVLPRVLTIPQTIPEVREESICSTPITPGTTIISAEVQPMQQTRQDTSKIQQNLSTSLTMPLKKPRPASFHESDDIQVLRALKETFSSTSMLPTTQPITRNIIYGSQPLGPDVPITNSYYPKSEIFIYDVQWRSQEFFMG